MIQLRHRQPSLWRRRGLATRNEHRTAKNLLERTNQGLYKLRFSEKILEITWQ